MEKKRNHNSVLLGMLICVIIALMVTIGGFAIMRRQLSKTKNTEEKGEIYNRHYAFIVENPEDEFWKKVYDAAKARGQKQ